MFQFFLRRLVFVLFILFFISLLVFVITEILPGDAAQMILGQKATPETLAALRVRLGVDQPAPAPDVLLAFPALLLALLMLSSLGSALIYLISAIGLVFAPAIARVLRSIVLELKTREFVEAAQMIGATAGRIMVRQIWPNLFNTLLVEAAIYFGYADV